MLFYVGLTLLAVSSIIACSSITPGEPATQPKTQPPAAVENQPPPSEAPTNEAEWTTVKSFIGSDSQTTPIFTISGSKWRIIWNVDTQNPQYAVFDILVYRQEALAMLITRISYSQGMSGDTVIIDEGGHDYFLKIICANLNRWTINIEEHLSESSNEPVQITHIHYKGTPEFTASTAGHEIPEYDEYIELKNVSDSPQNVAGWTLKNVTKGYPTFIFPMFTPCSCEYLGTWSKCVEECYPPRPCSIDPHKSIRIYTGEPDWATGGYCFYYGSGDIWNNETPDTAVLYNGAGQEVSRRSYIIRAKNTADQ
ncbi:MAG: lamin tail domain-containing protein [Dehalococcoidia bacterium]|nr:lamin tail domain-containing protein [Dehalococcoidia bacterium]